ncbi:MAG: type II secretion system protein [Conexivisphaerales archaeon]
MKRGFTMIELLLAVAFVAMFTASFVSLYTSVVQSNLELGINLRDVVALSDTAVVGNLIFDNSIHSAKYNISTSSQNDIFLLNNKATGIVYSSGTPDVRHVDFSTLDFGGVKLFDPENTALLKENIQQVNIEGVVVDGTPYYVSYNTLWNEKIFDSLGSVSLKYTTFQHVYRVDYYLSYKGFLIPYSFSFMVEPSYYRGSMYWYVQYPSTPNVYDLFYVGALNRSKIDRSLFNFVETYRIQSPTSVNLDTSSYYKVFSSYWGVPMGKSYDAVLGTVDATTYYVRTYDPYAYLGGYGGSIVPINGITVRYYAPNLIPGKDPPTAVYITGDSVSSNPYPQLQGYACIKNASSGGIIYIGGDNDYGERIIIIP